MIQLPSNLPVISTARLPEAYQAARSALSACEKIDECKDWADKAEALASYAKQAGDETLHRTAERIRARAIRRCGELLKQIEPQPGKRTDKETPGRHRPEVRSEELGSPPALISSPTRKEAAREAGLSERQQKTALRVAAIPSDDFERAVESPRPPTVSALAERGKKDAPKPLFDLGGRDPRDFKACTSALGEVRDFLDFMRTSDPAAVSRGASPNERTRLLGQIPEMLGWLTELMNVVERDSK